MKIKSVHARKVSYRENYERDALALRAGSEHYMDVLVVTVETVDGAVGVGEALSYGGVDTVASAVVKMRSEEHTSELQSRPHLVCRLLLEKKKITPTGLTIRRPWPSALARCT